MERLLQDLTLVIIYNITPRQVLKSCISSRGAQSVTPATFSGGYDLLRPGDDIYPTYYFLTSHGTLSLVHLGGGRGYTHSLQRHSFTRRSLRNKYSAKLLMKDCCSENNRRTIPEKEVENMQSKSAQAFVKRPVQRVDVSMETSTPCTRHDGKN